MPDRATLDRLIREKFPDDAHVFAERVTTFVCGIFDAERDIGAALSGVRREIAAEQQRHQTAVAGLETSIRTIQEKCPHYSVRHNVRVDSSDSYSACELCGKVIE